MQSFLVLLTFVSYLFAATPTTTHTTKYEVGPGRIMRDFSANGLQSTTDYKVIDLPILALASATGSATVKTAGAQDGTNGTKYASICIPNPLKQTGAGSGRTVLNRGSGAILNAQYKNVRNGNAMGGDIGFVKNCNSGTGDTLFNNTCTSSGCVMNYTASGRTLLQWNSADFIKLGLRGTPNSSFQSKLYLNITDLGGKSTR